MRSPLSHIQSPLRIQPETASLTLFSCCVTGILAPLDFSETDTTDVPEFDDVTSDAHSPDLPASCWGNEENTGPDTPDGQDLPDYYSNDIVTPGAEVPAGQDTPQPEASMSISQESLPQAE